MNKVFLEDLIKAQAEIKPIPKKGKNPHFKSEYAEYDDVVEACKVVCHKYNMFITHRITTHIATDLEEHANLTTEIHHTCGDHIESTMPLINKAGTDQGMGSSISYAKRYTLTSLLAVSTGDDDDGEKSIDRPVVIPDHEPMPSFEAFESLPKTKPKVEIPKTMQEKAAKALQGPTHQHRWMVSKQNPAVQFCAVKLANGSYCKEQLIDP